MLLNRSCIHTLLLARNEPNGTMVAKSILIGWNAVRVQACMPSDNMPFDDTTPTGSRHGLRNIWSKELQAARTTKYTYNTRTRHSLNNQRHTTREHITHLSAAICFPARLGLMVSVCPVPLNIEPSDTKRPYMLERNLVLPNTVMYTRITFNWFEYCSQPQTHWQFDQRRWSTADDWPICLSCEPN